MFKIQTLNAISPNGLNQFPAHLYQIGETIENPDAILVRSQNMQTMALPQSVKVIGRAGAGVNNIPVTIMTERGIPVLNTPGANANAVKEMVVAGMILASRHLCEAWDYVRQLQGSAEELEHQVEKNKKQFVGTELLGKTLGIVGLGNVGVKVANAAIHLGMKVLGFDPTITVDRAWEVSAEVKQAHDLDELLQKSDFISLHVPLNSETKHLINAIRLQLLKNNAVLLNFSRDGIIDNHALMVALNEKILRAYVSDFPHVEFKDHPSVITFPHLGASTLEAEENCAVMIVKQVRNFLEKGTINHSVNFPTIEMPRNQQATRVGIVNRNVPNMVAQISAKLADAGLNILSLLNKSKENIAYTLIDIDTPIRDGLTSEIATIPGIIQVRLISS